VLAAPTPRSPVMPASVATINGQLLRRGEGS
jgi:hypothetical protein